MSVTCGVRTVSGDAPDGDGTFSNPLVTTDTSESTSVSTGCIRGAGGLGIAKNATIGGSVVAASASLGNSTPLTVSSAGAAVVTNTTASTGTTSGALRIAGGVGVAGTLNAATVAVAGTLTATTVTAGSGVNCATLSATVSVSTASANVSGLTASTAVVTDGAKNLASLAYASDATASALAQRDASGWLASTNNLLALSDGSVGTTLTSSTTETTLWSCTVPGNTLASGSAIVMRGMIRIAQAVAGTCSLRVKLDGTTLCTVAANAGGLAANKPCNWYAVVRPTGANTQAAAAQLIAPYDGNAITDVYVKTASGTASVTQTGDLTLALTGQWDSSSSSLIATLYHMTAELSLGVTAAALP